MPHHKAAGPEPCEETCQLYVEEFEGLLGGVGGQLAGEAEVVQRPYRRAEVEGQTVTALQDAAPERLDEAYHAAPLYRPEDITCGREEGEGIKGPLVVVVN